MEWGEERRYRLSCICLQTSIGSPYSPNYLYAARMRRRDRVSVGVPVRVLRGKEHLACAKIRAKPGVSWHPFTLRIRFFVKISYFNQLFTCCKVISCIISE
jgi:hypothetical protein